MNNSFTFLKKKQTGFTFLRKKQTGFTLIELVVVAGIMIIISGIVAGTLVISLRSSIKTTVANNVSQSGNYAVSAITREVVASYDVISIGASLGCMTRPPSPASPISNTGESIVLKQEKQTVTFTCDGTTDPARPTIKKQVVPNVGAPEPIVDLFDSNVGYVGTSCSFTCNQPEDEYSAPIVNVKFNLTQLGSGSGSESISEASFNSSATLRNFTSF